MRTVAAALAIHPFMLSKWRKEARDGRLCGRAAKAPPAREIAKLQQLEREYALLKEEHDRPVTPARYITLNEIGTDTANWVHLLNGADVEQSPTETPRAGTRED